MHQKIGFRFWRPRMISLAVMLFALTLSSSSKATAQTNAQPADLGIEISLPDNSTYQVRSIGSGATLIPRNRLKVIDPKAAGEFTAIDVSAGRDTDGYRVRIGVIYNDLSNPEWWRDKKEKLIGSYLLRVGETAHALELNQFGIEPLTIKYMDVRHVVLTPGEGPLIINNTTALEVARLVEDLGCYWISLKNISGKNIVAYTISTGRTGQIASSGGRGEPAIAAGATAREVRVYGPNADREGITISNVIFDDGSFEGDSAYAAGYLARAYGLKIQAPSVLLRIDQTLAVDDGDLLAAFDKTEAELWRIPEAIDKQSALDYLTAKFPAVDEKMRSALYEELKGGLYDARNIALSEMGVNRRMIQERLQRNEDRDSALKNLRTTLESIKQTLERIMSGKL